MEKSKKGIIYWILVVIMFIVFWPIGCILLYIGLKEKYGKLKTNGITLILVAIFGYIMTLAGISITFEDLSKDLAINLFLDAMFLSGAIISTIFATKALKKYSQCKRTVEQIGARLKISIDNLSQETGKTIDATRRDIYEAIKYKMIDGYINEKDELIVNFNSVYDVDDNYIFDSIQNEREVTSIQCKNCGANNKFVEGEENRCEFCGSLLEQNYSFINE